VLDQQFTVTLDVPPEDQIFSYLHIGTFLWRSLGLFSLRYRIHHIFLQYSHLPIHRNKADVREAALVSYLSLSSTHYKIISYLPPCLHGRFRHISQCWRLCDILHCQRHCFICDLRWVLHQHIDVRQTFPLHACVNQTQNTFLPPTL
jgi:hypothetical protein